MAEFQDLDEFFSSDLRLPVGGKTYVIKSPDATTGLKATKLFQILAKALDGEQVDEAEVKSLELDDDEERDLYQRLMGDAYDEMIADRVDWEKLKFCGVTTLLWVVGGVEAAEDYWKRGGVPEEVPPNREARRRAGKGSGSRTPRRASTGGTTSRKVIEGKAERTTSAGTSS